MGRILSLIRRTGLVISPLLAAASLFFDAIDARSLGLPWNFWLGVGVAVFFACAVSMIWQQDREIKAARKSQPNIDLGEPIPEPNETLTRTRMVRGPWTLSSHPPPAERLPYEHLKIVLYRIPTTNHGAYAPEVTVKLVGISPEPPQGLRGAILHRAGDNPADRVTFSESFKLHPDDTVYLDFISFTVEGEEVRYFLHKIASQDAAEEIVLSEDSYVFTLGAYGGDRPKTQPYLITKDGVGRLTVTRQLAS